MAGDDMYKLNASRKYIFLLVDLILATIGLFAICVSNTNAARNEVRDDTPWTIHYRPGARFGTDGRTLFINDFIIPVYQDDKRILFGNVRYTPNDQDGREVNLGLGYRRVATRYSLSSLLPPPSPYPHAFQPGLRSDTV